MLIPSTRPVAALCHPSPMMCRGVMAVTTQRYTCCPNPYLHSSFTLATTQARILTCIDVQSRTPELATMKPFWEKALSSGIRTP